MPSQSDVLRGQVEEQAKIVTELRRMSDQTSALVQGAPPNSQQSKVAQELSGEIGRSFATQRDKLRVLERELAAVIDQEENRRRGERHESAEYWLRRFYTSLALGNGAGFALVTAALLQSQQVDEALVFAWEPMCYFGTGVLFAGALPWLLYIERDQPEGSSMHRVAKLAELACAVLAAGFFMVAVGRAVWTVTEAQRTAVPVAKLQRQVEGADLARRWIELQQQIKPVPRPAKALTPEATIER